MNITNCPNCKEPVNGRECRNCGCNPSKVDTVRCCNCGERVIKESARVSQDSVTAREVYYCQDC